MYFSGLLNWVDFRKKIPVQEKSRMAVHKAREKEGITVLLKSVLPPREMRISSWEFCLRRNKQQFSIQKRVQRTRTLMQIHCFTDILLISYSSIFTNVLIWDLKRQCFCSVSSFAMIVLGLACKFLLIFMQSQHAVMTIRAAASFSSLSFKFIVFKFQMALIWSGV